MAINNGILAINYARNMYTGHQSNMILYINCSDMSRVDGNALYTSHSFDERIYPTDDGGFIIANQGDAHKRGFLVGKVSLPQGDFRGRSKYFYTFHFRESTEYQMTYAQLGGIAELKNEYVFASSSERKLSLTPALHMLIHNDARDLFIQIIKKDFDQYTSVENIYAVQGETRPSEDTRPAGATVEMFLNGDEVDSGIIWLTSYDSSHYAANPKMTRNLLCSGRSVHMTINRSAKYIM